jgi:hypothetical protein
MDKNNVTFGKVEANTSIKVLNKPTDVPTFYVDSLSALILDDKIAKIGFVETLPSETGEAVARFVLNLAINRQGIKEIIERLADALERTEVSEAGLSK